MMNTFESAESCPCPLNIGLNSKICKCYFKKNSKRITNYDNSLLAWLRTHQLHTHCALLPQFNWLLRSNYSPYIVALNLCRSAICSEW